MLTANQKSLISLAKLNFDALSEERFSELCQAPRQIETATDAELTEFLAIANALYRGGDAIVSDAEYDFIYLAELEKRHPEHDMLQSVEAEPGFAGKTVDLPIHMLSTDKAYTLDDVERWAGRIEKAGSEIGKEFSKLEFRVTPKLDGYAAYDDGQMLYTRGDGRKGQDITRVFERGLCVAEHGARGLGAGEIVVSRSYFEKHLASHFDNARNFQASVIKEKQLDDLAQQAINDRAAVFYPFALLPCWSGVWSDLSVNFDAIVKSIWHKIDYDVDGVILEIVDEELKAYMGATRHHHRWQLAYKENLQTAEVKVVQVAAQTSRSGRVTPVAEFEPVRLSGALLSRATAHHFKMVIDKGIGPGAVIELARSGEVIPKIERVLQSTVPQIPDRCPSCNHELIWDNDYLLCPNNLSCPAQISNSMEHFFRVLKNNDGFGSATIAKLYEFGIRRVDEIYALTTEQFQDMGFGPKQSQNLVEQLTRSRHEAIEDWRFLAAFGVFRMGLGNCERLLKYHALADIFALSETDIVAIEGFAEKTAAVIIEGFAAVKPLFDGLLSLGFNLQPSQYTESPHSHPLAGKLLVFTGTLHSGSRDELSKQAKAKGAKIGASVSAKTDYLVAGDNVGAAKLNAANDKGVTIISESEFLALLNGTGS